jgi:hypothetical protein
MPRATRKCSPANSQVHGLRVEVLLDARVSARLRQRAIAVSVWRETNLSTGSNAMSLGTILLVILILMLIGAFPSWPHSQSWGYLPSGGLGLLLLIVIILLVLGKL